MKIYGILFLSFFSTVSMCSELGDHIALHKHLEGFYSEFNNLKNLVDEGDMNRSELQKAGEYMVETLKKEHENNNKQYSEVVQRERNAIVEKAIRFIESGIKI